MIFKIALVAVDGPRLGARKVARDQRVSSNYPGLKFAQKSVSAQSSINFTKFKLRMSCNQPCDVALTCVGTP